MALPDPLPPSFTSASAASRDMRLALRQVLYEIQMAAETAAALKPTPGRSQFGNNVILESFVVHARNLFEFFYETSISKTRIKPRHFFPWTQCVCSDRALFAKMHADVIHLGYGRKPPGDARDWTPYQVMTHLLKPATEFLTKAHADTYLMAYMDNRHKTETLLGRVPVAAAESPAAAS